MCVCVCVCARVGGCVGGYLLYSEERFLDYNINISELEIESRYIQTNAFGERHEPPYPSCYGLNSTTLVLI